MEITNERHFIKTRLTVDTKTLEEKILVGGDISFLVGPSSDPSLI